MSLEPGKPCPACERRVPFPKTEKTPPTKHMGYWVPANEFEAHETIIKNAAEHLGVHDQPFWEFKTAAMAFYLVRQDESLKDFAKR